MQRTAGGGQAGGWSVQGGEGVSASVACRCGGAGVFRLVIGQGVD